MLLKISKNFTLLILFFMVILPITAQTKVKGKILFSNGSSKNFHNLIYIRAFSNTNNGKEYSKWGNSFNIYYKNSIRKIPFNKMASIKILNWKSKKDYINARVEFITTTGIRIINDDCDLENIKVEMLDELTGEVKEQVFNFCFNEKLNIKKIVLNN